MIISESANVPSSFTFLVKGYIMGGLQNPLSLGGGGGVQSYAVGALTSARSRLPTGATAAGLIPKVTFSGEPFPNDPMNNIWTGGAP